MAVKGPNHQMRTRIRGLTVLFALIGFGLVGVDVYKRQALRRSRAVLLTAILSSTTRQLTAS